MNLLKKMNKMNTMKSINKKIAIIITVIVMTVGNVHAQIIVQDGDNNSNRSAITNFDEYGLYNPLQGVTYDQFAPLGGGSLLLIGFGSAYLLSKRKRKE